MSEFRAVFHVLPKAKPLTNAALAAALVFVWGGFSRPCSAKPPYKHSLKKLYGARLPAALHQCTTCHQTKNEAESPEEFDPEYPPHNVFGLRLKALGTAHETEESEGAGESADIIARLKQAAAEDADGDGTANELEILAGRQPGRAGSVPSAEELAAATAARAAWQEETSRYAWEPFQPVVRPGVPQVANLDWVITPVDAFIADEYPRHGLTPAPEAPPHVLLRRVYLDLIGLPPTREQLHGFLNDPAADRYERVVEQLLASPQYGQRWGRHWMDVWRYSDWAGWTDGKQIRDSQPHIWRWRDWIVDALNADRPYDSMVHAMLAADELTPTLDADLPATGFLVRNYKMLSRETWLQETVEHTAKAFLGVTLNCARCHDHMYDPFSQEEYYRFRAIFEPHNVRIDRLPGQADTTVDGLPRVYDAEPAASTYLFVKGDDRNPDKDRPIAPAVPEALGGHIQIQGVPLPAAAHYPGLQPHVQQQLNDAAAAAVAKSQEQQAASQTALSAVEARVKELAALAQQGVPAEEGKPDPSAELSAAELAVAAARRAHSAAELAVAAAVAQQQSLTARIAADAAKYAATVDPNAAPLAAAASKAERQAVVAQAAHESAVAENALADLEAKFPAPDEAAQKQIAEARQKRDAAKEKLAMAVAAAEPAAETYAPIVASYPAESTGRRAALARWLTANENPLAARVAVNHIWLRHFGQGLVESVFDFGQNGKPPTHPALLDWLAAEFMSPTWQPATGQTATERTASGQPANSQAAISQATVGQTATSQTVASQSASSDLAQQSSPTPWSMKHMHRLLVTSRVYRLASTHDAAQSALDADNRYLARMPARRMEAELVRDAVLHVAGRLDLSAGGADIDYAQGLTVPRRSLYFRHAAEKQMTFLKIFDAAAVSECYRRKSSVMPQQALALANSELTIAQARHLARSWNQAGQTDPAEFVQAAFEQILARTVSAAELEACLKFLESQAQRITVVASQETAATTDLADVSRPAADPAMQARESLIHVLINHHDFVTVH